MSEGKNRTGCFVVVGCLIVLVIALLVIREIKSPIHAEYESYIYITATQNADVPYLRGKTVAVLVDPTLNSLPEVFDQLQRALPADLQAHRPEDVGTAIRLQRSQRSVGYCVYKDGPKAGQRAGDAYRQCYRLSIIDVSIQAVIHQQDFCGGDPPPTVEAGPCAGSDPFPEVVAYILTLPRK